MTRLCQTIPLVACPRSPHYILASGYLPSQPNHPRTKETVMTLSPDWPWHFMPILMMLVMVGANHVITHIRTERRYLIEASRLCAALSSELRLLQDIYRMNLGL